VVQKVTAKQMQLVRQAERMDRMAYVGTLASGLAHEIRNPLSAMTVNLDVLREELEEVLQPTVALAATGTSDALPSTHLDDTKLQAIQRIGGLVTRVRREIQGLNTTLSHFLDFALPSKEGMTEFPLRGLMEEIIELHREQCRQKEITIEISGAPASQTIIEADRRLCHQALRNIIINAIQVLEGCVPRQIRIRVNPAGSVVRLTISDTGPGIDPEKLDSIFEAFVSGRKGGTGLGLALTRKIVEEHHGRITASNNPDGPGAVFTVELPIRQPLSS
jgi:signal transduction histidine kinase